MKILHYSLGFPPYRSGGMTAYCMDLMTAQRTQNHEVALLWPGDMGLKDGKSRIKERIRQDGIYSFELIHPLPVALDEGIVRTKKFMEMGDLGVYLDFLKMFAPDIIHFHTFMGIHKEFLEAAEKCQIPMIYTTHDFYGLCPKVTFFHDGDICKNDDCADCVCCNQTALSMNKIRLMQSPLYRHLKDCKLMQWMRQRHRTDFFEENSSSTGTSSEKSDVTSQEAYQELRTYYEGMLQKVTGFHYNSSITKQIYEKFLPKQNGKTIQISNSGIRMSQKEKQAADVVQISFLAAPNPIKGYHILIQALDELWQEGYRNFRLHSYGNGAPDKDYLRTYPRYQIDELENILDKTDLVVVPSCWYETFGFVVPEALSCGVPLLVTNRVGAKDLLVPGKSGIVVAADAESLKQGLKSILDSPEWLQQMNRYIIQHTQVITMEQHQTEMENFYHENIVLCADQISGRD